LLINYMGYSFRVSQVVNRMSAGLLMAALIMSSLPFAAMAAEVKIFTASISPSSIDAGATESVSITISNDGSSSADIKSAKIVIPTGFTASNFTVSNSNFEVALVGNEIQVSLKPGSGNNGLVAGASFIVGAQVTNISGSGSSSWQVCTYKNNSFNPGDGAAFDILGGTGCGNLTIRIVEPPVPTADLSIVKTVNTTTPFEGATVTYTLTVTNDGPDTASGVVVTDPLALGLTYVSASVAPDSTSPLTWNVGTLADNGTWTVDVTVAVGADQGGASITNTASATSTIADPVSTNNSSSVTIRPADVLVQVPGCTDRNAVNFNEVATQDDGSCTYELTVSKVVAGTTTADYTPFSFKVDGGATTTFEQDGTNIVIVSSSTHSVVENEAVGYTTTYTNCSPVVFTAGKATCTITNTPVNATKYGNLVVEKKVEGVTAPDYTTFSFILDGGATTTFDVDGVNEFSLPVGTHTVFETPAAGYTTTYNNCQDVSVVEGATTTCTVTNTKNSEPAPTCTVEVVSNTSDFVVEKGAFAQALSFVHPAWTAAISGATWIWGDNPVINPVVAETQTFRKQFGFTGTVTDAKLYVASDNSHSVVFNASSTAGDATENNFQLATQDVYDVTSLVAQGNNELKIAVTNMAGDANPASNPAGLLYKLVISGRPTVDTDCSVPYVPPTPEVDTYRIKGYVWHDDNKNTEWDGLYSEEQEELIEDSLAGWTVNITNGTSSFSTTTDETGFYYFDVPAGTWTITEVVQNGWERTTQESHVVTVPIAPVVTLLDSVRNFFIPTAHAALLATYGDYNFGNDTVDIITPDTPTRSGGNGGSGTRVRPTPTVAGVTDSVLPTPLVLGEQVSVVPVGAPNAGAGGTSPQWPTFTLGQLMMAATRRLK
jgi:uncharacterized repeat protein (TIGR01451 family)